MVHVCAIFGCTNRSNRERHKRFFRLPAIKRNVSDRLKLLQEQRRNEWVKRIAREDFPPKKYANARICSDHFVSGKPSSLHQRDSIDWAPSKDLGYDFEYLGTIQKLEGARLEKERIIEETSWVTTSKSEELRHLEETQQICDTESINTPISTETIEVTEEIKQENDNNHFNLPFREMATQTDIDFKYLKFLQNEIISLRQENSQLKKRLQESSENKDEIIYYTQLILK